VSVTESDQNGQATKAIASGALTPPEDLQDARTRATPHPTPGNVNEASGAVTQSDVPWSLRAGNALRSGWKASVTHPRKWGIWDQHPASTRAVLRRAGQYGPCSNPNALVRWPARAAAAAVAGWSAVFCTLAVAPRSKTCWWLLIVALVALLTWKAT